MMHVEFEDGTVAKPHETGEVVFRREVIGFQGYLNDAEANATRSTRRRSSTIASAPALGCPA